MRVTYCHFKGDFGLFWHDFEVKLKWQDFITVCNYFLFLLARFLRQPLSVKQ
jgi:hypothetical protein